MCNMNTGVNNKTFRVRLFPLFKKEGFFFPPHSKLYKFFINLWAGAFTGG